MHDIRIHMVEYFMNDVWLVAKREKNVFLIRSELDWNTIREEARAYKRCLFCSFSCASARSFVYVCAHMCVDRLDTVQFSSEYESNKKRCVCVNENEER